MLLQVVQFNYSPLVLVLIARADANTGTCICLYLLTFAYCFSPCSAGMLFALEEDLRDPVSELQAAVSVP